MRTKPILGVIGGSGLYEMEGVEDIQIHDLQTPFGVPTSPVLSGELNGRRVAFIARHGPGHVYTPSEVNYLANIYAFKLLDIDRVLSVSACGSLREDYAPGEIVIPDQLFDRTHQRQRTFFGESLVAHVSVGDPFCEDLSNFLGQAVSSIGGTAHQGGAFITIEGPRFSTRAEANTYRAWGMSIIGMTTSPEAFLAREAEMCYAVMAHVTDYDVWHVSEEQVTVEMVVRILKANAKLAQKAIGQLVSDLPERNDCDCLHALRDAFITAPEQVPSETYEKLLPLVKKYLS